MLTAASPNFLAPTQVAAEVLQVLERFDLEPDRQGSGSLRAPTAEVSSAL